MMGLGELAGRMEESLKLLREIVVLLRDILKELRKR